MKIEGFESIDKLIAKFEKIDDQTDKICHEALYEGAGIIADSIKARIEALPIQEKEDGSAPWGTPEKPLTGITTAQKSGLINGFGVAKHRNEGGAFTTSVGFSGVNSDGRPNAGVARSVESGSSFRRKNPFFRTGVNAAKARAEKAMKDKILNKMKEID